MAPKVMSMVVGVIIGAGSPYFSGTAIVGVSQTLPGMDTGVCLLRAKYIVGAIKVLEAKPGGGVEWLASLRSMGLHDVLEALCTLPGVGPKVAACIALFSLDQHHAIPVDTHVWQIATRYFLPELAGTQLTPKLCARVSEAFVARFGKYAGWAQTVLFIGELPSQKTSAQEGTSSSSKRKPNRRKVAAK